jgi:hypothetical protein
MNNTFRVFADRCQCNTKFRRTPMARACVKLEKKDASLNLFQLFQFLDIYRVTHKSCQTRATCVAGT